MGEIAPDSGEIHFDGRSIGGLSTAARVRRGIARTFQITELLTEDTALENVALPCKRGRAIRFALSSRGQTPMRP